MAYHGGPERVFRRAESAAFFGREIGLLYVHAHLRYGEAMAVLGEPDALWDALQVVNPVGVGEVVANARRASATPTSAAATRHSPTATGRRRVGARPGRHRAVDGGWRIYSSGPGLYTGLLLCHALGIRRRFGERIVAPVLPRKLGRVTLEMDSEGGRERWISRQVLRSAQDRNASRRVGRVKFGRAGNDRRPPRTARVAMTAATMMSGQPVPVPNTPSAAREHGKVREHVIARAIQTERMFASPARQA